MCECSLNKTKGRSGPVKINWDYQDQRMDELPILRSLERPRVSLRARAKVLLSRRRLRDVTVSLTHWIFNYRLAWTTYADATLRMSMDRWGN